MIGVSLLIATLTSTQVQLCVAILRNYNLSMFLSPYYILAQCSYWPTSQCLNKALRLANSGNKTSLA